MTTKDAFYFPHDSNAKDDPKIVMMIEQLGLESYGIFWVLVEILRDQPEFKYPLALLPAMSRRYNTTTEKMRAVVMNYGLFQIHDDEFFFSPSLNNRMLPLLEKKEQARLAAHIRWEKHKQLMENNNDNADAMRTHSECNADPMPKREEKRREEKSIEEKSKVENFVTTINTIFKKQYRVTEKVTPKIKRILKEYTIHEIEKAAGNAKKSEFHKENGWAHLTPEFFTRSDKVDMWLNATSKKQSEEPGANIPQLDKYANKL